jgi:hypothetical protein
MWACGQYYSRSVALVGVAQLDHSMLAGSGDWLAGASDSVKGKRGPSILARWHQLDIQNIAEI